MYRSLNKMASFADKKNIASFFHVFRLTLSNTHAGSTIILMDEVCMELWKNLRSLVSCSALLPSR
ncbi:protein of unknown function [Paenibacillus alvei]|uniref:Uncharacterized protein n=1 Tax=Paenibacillus alvei TaxID=44250 RepID=A0A383RL15_PAEAL|nr:protein of unknown function [Paenibacillus alvei]